MKSYVNGTTTLTVEKLRVVELAYQKTATKILWQGIFAMLLVIVFILVAFYVIAKSTIGLPVLAMCIFILIMVVNVAFALKASANLVYFRRVLNLTTRDQYFIIGKIGITLCLFPFVFLLVIL